MENKRLIELKIIPLILSVIYWVLLYLLLLKYFNANPDISDLKYKDFYMKYTMFSPVIFWLLSIILLYLLLFIKYILRIKLLIVTILIYFVVFGLYLFLWIDFMYLESRIAPLAALIINTFSIPLIISSSIVIIMIILLSLKKVKTEK